MEVKWGRGSLRDLLAEKGYVLTLDEFEVDGRKAMLPVSVFLYLISSQKVL